MNLCCTNADECIRRSPQEACRGCSQLGMAGGSSSSSSCRPAVVRCSIIRILQHRHDSCHRRPIGLLPPVLPTAAAAAVEPSPSPLRESRSRTVNLPGMKLAFPPRPLPLSGRCDFFSFAPPAGVVVSCSRSIGFLVLLLTLPTK
jgi:hypothetical protein